MKEYAFGIDLGGTTAKIGLFKTTGELLEKWEVPTDTSNAGEHILENLANAIRGKMAEKEIPAEQVEGVGIGVPGPVLNSSVVPIVCANLPYNITTPFLTACVRAGCFRQLTVLIQKEVALRICAKPGTADYGAFSLLMQYYTVPELLFEVPNSCFMPPPKVTSAVVRCVTRKAPPVQVRSEEAFWRTVRAGFALRRKTLVNSLQTGWQLPKEQLAAIVAGCGLSPTVRGEALGLEEYARLSDALLAAAGE